MEISIRKWQIEDAEQLKNTINNEKILDNLRDGIPYPYTIENAQEFITQTLKAPKEGIMSKVVKEVCKYIFENTNIIRIFAEPFAYNIASCKVLEKAGFELEGILRSNAIKNGRISDMKIYSIIK